MCILEHWQHRGGTKAVAISHRDSEGLQKLSMREKQDKELAKMCDAFLASKSLIK